DNGTGTVSVMVAGGYVTCDGTNTYTGGIYVLSGRYSQATATNLGPGPVIIGVGGEINTNGTFPATTPWTIAGDGTPESGNLAYLGAIRLFGTANIQGPITLARD